MAKHMAVINRVEEVEAAKQKQNIPLLFII